MAKINLRGKLEIVNIEADVNLWQYTYDICEVMVRDPQFCGMTIEKPRRWGKTRLLAELSRKYNNTAILTCRYQVRDIENRYNLKHVYSIDHCASALCGTNFDFIFFDETTKQQVEWFRSAIFPVRYLHLWTPRDE